MKKFDSFISAIKSGSITNFNIHYKPKYLYKVKSKEDNQLPIHIACEKGQIEIVKLLIDKKSDIDIPTSWNKMFPIHYACENGYVDIVKILIDNKCNIEACNWNDYRPIHIASEKGFSDIVQILVNNKCEIDAFNKYNNRPIHLACRYGHAESVQILINNKCDISAVNDLNQSPLEIATQLNNKEIINIIKNYTEQTNNIHNFFAKICGFELFIKAIKTGSIEDFHKYYKFKYLEKYYGMENRFAIHFACIYGHIDIVKLLINNKCNIEVCDKNNNRPIHCACIQRNIETNNKENWHLNLFASANEYVEIVQFLINNKCNVEANTMNGQLPIHLACENGFVDILQILIKTGCNLEIATKNGLRPIHYACINGNEEILKILITNNCDINSSDENGQSPLHYACKYDHTKIAQILIENKCDIEACDKDKQSPIHMTNNNEILNLWIDSEFKFQDNFNNITIRPKMGELNSENSIEKNEISERNYNCKNCNVGYMNMKFDCGHTVCDQCGPNLNICHVCGKTITTKEKIYL